MGRYLDLARILDLDEAQGAKQQIAQPRNAGGALLPDSGSGCEISELSELSPGSAVRKNSVSRVALVAVPDGVPEAWVQGVGDLLVMPPHPAWTDEGWTTLQEDARRFLQQWAAQAHRLGWDVLNLYGVHRGSPMARLDCRGLVPLLRGRAVLALTEDRAAIEVRPGGRQTYRRKPVRVVDQCPVWVL